MPRSKGRASRSESGTWRRGSAEDDNDEPGISEEEIIVAKARAPSVARSTRGRRPKAAPSPAVATDAVETPAEAKRRGKARGSVERIQRPEAPISKLLVTAVALLGLCCVLCMLAYNSSCPTPEEPPFLGLSDSEYVYSELQKIARSEKDQLLEAVETLKRQLNKCGSCPKNPTCVCPECPACVQTVVCTTERVDSIESIRSPIPQVLLPLPTWLANHPVITNAAQLVLDYSYEAAADHPWAYLLLGTLAAWKAIELLVRAVKTGGAYASEAADRVVRGLDGEDKVALAALEEESEKARKEAEERLLLRMKTIERED